MPDLDGRTLIQVLIAFVMVAALALVLRWSFAKDHDRSSRGAAAGEPDDQHGAPARKTSATAAAPSSPPAGPAGGPSAGPTGPDDYGLLATVAVVDTADEAARMRTRLMEAGIRATTSRGGDGRHRVLVFRPQLERARRVGRGS